MVVKGYQDVREDNMRLLKTMLDEVRKVMKIEGINFLAFRLRPEWPDWLASWIFHLFSSRHRSSLVILHGAAWSYLSSLAALSTVHT